MEKKEYKIIKTKDMLGKLDSWLSKPSVGVF